jgi:hypothetical protein
MKKGKIIEKAKLYWGRAKHAREQLAIAQVLHKPTAKLRERAEMYEAYSRSLFKSLPTSKEKALNKAKSKTANVAREQTSQAKKALGPAPQENWVIAKDERAKPNSPRQPKPSRGRSNP